MVKIVQPFLIFAVSLYNNPQEVAGIILEDLTKKLQEDFPANLVPK
jgi:hypothetical protein